MNWSHISKNIGVHVELQPLPYRVNGDGLPLPDRNDDWLIRSVSDSAVDIYNVQTGHAVSLNKDHIHHYTTNSVRTAGSARYGFLTLLIQLYIGPTDIRMVPTVRPGERLPPPADPTVKVVTLQYPTASGLQQRLEQDGYRLYWCSENKIADRELEGWEVVFENDVGQGLVKFKVPTRPFDLILMKKRA